MRAPCLYATCCRSSRPRCCSAAANASRRRRATKSARAIFCDVTKDSEIYINDALSRLEAIEPGDAIEMVGYPDPNPRLGRFVVSYAHVLPGNGQRRAEPAAGAPPTGVPRHSAATNGNQKEP